MRSLGGGLMHGGLQAIADKEVAKAKKTSLSAGGTTAFRRMSSRGKLEGLNAVQILVGGEHHENSGSGGSSSMIQRGNWSRLNSNTSSQQPKLLGEADRMLGRAQGGSIRRMSSLNNDNNGTTMRGGNRSHQNARTESSCGALCRQRELHKSGRGMYRTMRCLVRLFLYCSFLFSSLFASLLLLFVSLLFVSLLLYYFLLFYIIFLDSPTNFLLHVFFLLFLSLKSSTEMRDINFDKLQANAVKFARVQRTKYWRATVLILLIYAFGFSMMTWYDLYQFLPLYQKAGKEKLYNKDRWEIVDKVFMRVVIRTGAK